MILRTPKRREQSRDQNIKKEHMRAEKEGVVGPS